MEWYRGDKEHNRFIRVGGYIGYYSQERDMGCLYCVNGEVHRMRLGEVDYYTTVGINELFLTKLMYFIDMKGRVKDESRVEFMWKQLLGEDRYVTGKEADRMINDYLSGLGYKVSVVSDSEKRKVADYIRYDKRVRLMDGDKKMVAKAQLIWGKEEFEEHIIEEMKRIIERDGVKIVKDSEWSKTWNLYGITDEEVVGHYFVYRKPLLLTRLGVQCYVNTLDELFIKGE